MSELRLLIGLPASGKTSYAFNLIATEPDWIRINWDEDRIFHGLHLKKFDRKAEEQMHAHQDTKQWESFVTSHGGKLTENVVQAIARDVLAEGMLRADAEGFHVCGHVHDEIITEGLDNPFELDYKDLERVMSVPMPWAPDLPLGAEGYSGNYYRKG